MHLENICAKSLGNLTESPIRQAEGDIMDLNENIKNNIQRLRKERNITQEVLADALELLLIIFFIVMKS